VGLSTAQTAPGEGSPAQPSTVDIVFADVPSRLVAYAVDALILTIVVFVGALVVSALIGPTVRFGDAGDALRGEVAVDRSRAIVDGVISTALGSIYFIGSWIVLGGSPGLRLLGMRLRRETDGGRIGFRAAFVRWLLLGGPFGLATLLALGVPVLRLSMGAAVAAWYLILLVTTARSASKQGLHDHYAHTVVTKVARRPSWVGPG
jgi:RDD family protein